MIVRLARRGKRLSDLERDFTEALAAENLSPATIEHYATRLGHLRDRLGDIPVASIRGDMLRRFLLSVKSTPHKRHGGPVSDRYVEQHRKAFVRFFAWCVDAGAIRESPATGLKTWRVDEEEIEVLEPEEVALLLDACPAGYEGERDRAIIGTLYGTGVRRRELVTISLVDVDLDAGEIKIRGKARKGRTVPMGPRLREVLRRYLEEVRPRVLIGDSGRLFVDRRAVQLLPNALNLMLRVAARRAGVDGQVSPHVFRHSFATEYLRNDGKRKALKIILGHTTDAMLDRYTHFVERDVAKDHAAASPFERLATRARARPAGDAVGRGSAGPASPRAAARRAG